MRTILAVAAVSLSILAPRATLAHDRFSGGVELEFDSDAAPPQGYRGPVLPPALARAAWIPGFWAWNGFGYGWMPGHWASGPRHPRWERRVERRWERSDHRRGERRERHQDD